MYLQLLNSLDTYIEKTDFAPQCSFQCDTEEVLKKPDYLRNNMRSFDLETLDRDRASSTSNTWSNSNCGTSKQTNSKLKILSTSGSSEALSTKKSMNSLDTLIDNIDFQEQCNFQCNTKDDLKNSEYLINNIRLDPKSLDRGRASSTSYTWSDSNCGKSKKTNSKLKVLSTSSSSEALSTRKSMNSLNTDIHNIDFQEQCIFQRNTKDDLKNSDYLINNIRLEPKSLDRDRASSTTFTWSTSNCSLCEKTKSEPKVLSQASSEALSIKNPPKSNLMRRMFPRKIKPLNTNLRKRIMFYRREWERFRQQIPQDASRYDAYWPVRERFMYRN